MKTYLRINRVVNKWYRSLGITVGYINSGAMIEFDLIFFKIELGIYKEV